MPYQKECLCCYRNSDIDMFAVQQTIHVRTLLK